MPDLAVEILHDEDGRKGPFEGLVRECEPDGLAQLSSGFLRVRSVRIR
jgi:hypothetical protein